MQDLVRIDKWLWAARFYKTRSLATAAVEGGHVHVNNHRVKASYRVKANDMLLIKKSSVKHEVLVQAMAERRGSASQAQQLYVETQESIEQRELFVTQRKLLSQSMPRSAGKPNKHDRKKIRKVIGKD